MFIFPKYSRENVSRLLPELSRIYLSSIKGIFAKMDEVKVDSLVDAL